MLEDGTDGELITWDATGSPTTVPVGTSGHVLTSNGVGAEPTFQASGGGTVDTSGTPIALDFARFTDADTIEGRSYAETKADLDLEIGTDVLAEQTIGIADNNLVEVDQVTTAASGEIARFTATGLESRSDAEMKTQLGYMTDLVDDATPQAGANIDMNAFDVAFDTATGIVDENDNEQIIFTTTASAVNYVSITNSATANDPAIIAAGSDTDINLELDGKGTGDVSILSDDVIVAGTVDGRDVLDDGQAGDNLITLSGVARDAADLGTFTGTTITDTSTIKTALQELETSVETAGSSGVTTIDETAAGIYNTLTGLVNSSNTVYTVSLAAYTAGTLKVWWQGQLQSGADITETTPGSGIFTLSFAPTTGTTVMAEYR
jgi:hypothetical protein